MLIDSFCTCTTYTYTHTQRERESERARDAQMQTDLKGRQAKQLPLYTADDKNYTFQNTTCKTVTVIYCAFCQRQLQQEALHIFCGPSSHQKKLSVEKNVDIQYELKCVKFMETSGMISAQTYRKAIGFCIDSLSLSLSLSRLHIAKLLGQFYLEKVLRQLGHCSTGQDHHLQ